MKRKKIVSAKLSRKKYIRAEKTDLLSVLDINPDEDIAADSSSEGISDNRRGKRINRKLYFITGIAVLLLSAAGLISLMLFAVDKIENIVNNTEQKNEFAEIIYPLVICDPAPFDNVSALNGETVVTAACWEIILNGDPERYDKDFDYITVPETDIEKAAADLFGQGLTISHSSIINSDIQFYYSADKKSYRIPYSPKFLSYSPQVENISGNGGGYIVEVGYITPTPAWFSDKSKTAPEKYMVYVLEKQSDEYIITSVKLSERNSESNNGL